VLGYESLPDTPPVAALTPRVRSESRRGLDAVRRQMASLDYQETINFSFVEERWEHELAGNANPISLVNPMAGHLAVMRSCLLGSLVGVLRLNLARKANRVRVFEAGRVYLRDPSVTDGDENVAGVAQPLRLAGLVYGAADASQWGMKERVVDFFDLKGDIEALLSPRVTNFVPASHPAMHPGRCASIESGGVPIGFAGELHPKWRQSYELPAAPLMFELDVGALVAREVPVYASLQRHQSVWRDISVIAAEAVTYEALMRAISRAEHGGLVRSAQLFDIYRPAAPHGDMQPGERSMSVRLELLDDVTTLTDERIDVVVAKVLATLAAQLGARLRG
jgi:phenylalanyl-tRNA synthetase beta chain